MTTTINDGGPAYPCYETDFQPGTGEQVIQHTYHGMSLRDYFAAKAMCGMLLDGAGDDNEKIAKWSYDIADAMLKAREVKQ